MGTARKSRIPLNVALVTVSNRRTPDDDPSGTLIGALLQTAGHRVVSRGIAHGNPDILRERIRQLLLDPQIDVIVSNGGTGIDDSMPEAVRPLLDREIPGFSMLFHALSYQQVGSAGILSRAMAGVVGNKLVFLIPGSEDGTRLAMEKIILPQLDSTTTPCNLVGLLRKTEDRTHD